MRDIKDIKFTAKPMSKHPSYPKWVFGLIQSIATDNTGFLREEHKNCIHIKANTIGQFTGLYDKNGIEIYEGDIVHLFGYGEYEGIDYNGLVIFKDGGFCVIDGLEDDYSFARYDFNKCGIEVTVIGNIYDNPELLEVN